MDGIPTLPPAFPIILLMEILFGIGFNALVEWAHHHNLWHVSVSVSAGVALTVTIATVGLWSEPVSFWQAGLIMLLCFSASGVPMIAGSTRRTVKESHQRRPLPNNAMRVRDDVVMELSAAVETVVDGHMDLARLVHLMHQWIGKLRSM
jgi:hypothetical protein